VTTPSSPPKTKKAPSPKTPNKRPLRPSDFGPLTRTQVLIGIAITAIVMLAIAKGWQWTAQQALLNWDFDGEELIGGALLGLGISAASFALYRLWPAYQASADRYLSLVLEPLVWSDLIWLALLPGMSEELLFRGVMLPGLGFNLLGVAATSACFGVLHMSGRDQWPYALWATIVGGFLGLSALMTGNLMVPVVAHIVANLGSGIVWKLGFQSVEAR
jgi:uncharacterized protein